MGIGLCIFFLLINLNLYGYQSTLRLINKLGEQSNIKVYNIGEASSHIVASGASDFHVQIILAPVSSWELEVNIPQQTVGMTELIFDIFIDQRMRACQYFVGFEDQQGHYEEKNVTTFLRRMKGRWGRLRIGLDKFYLLALKDLKKLKIRVESEDESGRVDIKVKEISFRSSKIDEVQTKRLERLKGVSRFQYGRSQQELIDLYDKEGKIAFLRQIYKDLWSFLSQAVDKETELPVDNIHFYPQIEVGNYTSPTNISMYMMSLVSARDYGLISQVETQSRLEHLLQTLGKLKRYKGGWYNFYNTETLEVTREYISSVDLGWIVAGLIVVRNAVPELKEKVNQLLKDVNFNHLLHQEYGQLFIGYEADKKTYPPYHYGLVATEIRITSLVAMALGEIPELHWYLMFRAFPPRWDWQNGTPVGITRFVKGLENDKFYQLYYNEEGIKVVPSWGGSMFEALMPGLVFNEKKLSPQGFYPNGQANVILQMRFSEKKGLPVWGYSPCATPDGGYVEVGIKQASVKGYEERELVTAHASFLALPYKFDEAVENIRTMIEKYPIYGLGGLYDSIQFKEKKAIVSYRYLYLDQGMSFLSLSNILQKGVLWKYFEEDEDIKKVIHLLDEEFFPEPTEI